MRSRLDQLRRLWTASRRHPPSSQLKTAPPTLVVSVDELVGAGDRDRVVELFESLTVLEVDDQEEVSRRFYQAFQSFGDAERAARALTRAAGPHNCDANTVWREAEQGNLSAARRMFADRVGQFVGANALDDWVACFDVLFDPLVSPETSGLEGADSPTGIRFERTVGDRWRFLAVSGMGWSGSGAVYDSLRDYTAATAVGGESRLLEGRYGLTNLPQRSEQHGLALRHSLRNLFRFNLLGFASCNDWEDYRHVRNARRASTGPMGDAIASTSYAALSALLAATPEDQADTVNQWAQKLLEAATLAQVANVDTVPVLDNVVHVANLDIAGLLPDVLFFAVVRDPRDQFLDLVHKNRRFHGDPHRFAKRYRKVRSRLDDMIATGTDSVRVISFEQFILDSHYRDAVLSDVTYDLGGQRRRRRFDPKVSRENVGLWRRADRVDAIRTIEAALPEYVVHAAR